MRNLDYIRTLSAEELADLLYDYWLPRGQYAWSHSKKGLVKVLGEEYFECDRPQIDCSLCWKESHCRAIKEAERSE